MIPSDCVAARRGTGRTGRSFLTSLQFGQRPSFRVSRHLRDTLVVWRLEEVPLQGW